MTTDRRGDFDVVTLDNDAIRLACVPALGGRIVSLLDRRTRREWLVQGEPPSADEAAAWARDDAAFGGREAFGWDECLPTVTPCADPLDPAGPSLRDHGDQWGRPTVVSLHGDHLMSLWPSGRWPFRFERTIALEGSAVVVGYRLTNDGDRLLPFLWSMHPLIDLAPAERIELPAGTRLSMPFATGRGLSAGEVTWPGSVDLSVARTVEARMAAKLYADPRPAGAIRAWAQDGSSIAFEWGGPVASALGLWLSDGGWPLDGPGVRQRAIEPTTSSHDRLTDAIDARRAVTVHPGDSVAWSVRIVLAAGP